MNTSLKVAKYQLMDFKKSVLVYYSVVIALLLVIPFMLNQINGTTINFNGGGGSAIMVFVIGLNSFKSSFKFMQANNISRKKFFMGNIISLVTLCGIMASIDYLLGTVLNSLTPYESIFHQIYLQNRFLDKLLWSFTILTLFAVIGWTINMFYYRSNKYMKIMISIAPVFLIMFISYLNRFTDGELIRSISRFLLSAFGVSGVLNPYMAVLSFIVATVGISGLIYLLIYKAPIKD